MNTFEWEQTRKQAKFYSDLGYKLEYSPCGYKVTFGDVFVGAARIKGKPPMRGKLKEMNTQDNLKYAVITARNHNERIKANAS